MASHTGVDCMDVPVASVRRFTRSSSSSLMESTMLPGRALKLHINGAKHADIFR